MGRYSVHLVGEANYQPPIGRLSPGDPVQLIPEPGNPHDPRAIRCADVTGETLGYVERDSWLARAMLDQATPVSATVLEIVGGAADQPSLGVVLTVLSGADATGVTPDPAPARKGPAAMKAMVHPAPGAPSQYPPKKKGGCLKVAGWAFGGLFGLAVISAILDTDPKVTKTAADPAASGVPTPEPESVKQAEDRRKGFHCLSKWDGSHRELVNELKRSLREPDSFEHVETRITPVNAKGVHLLTMEYRARNGFGGMNVGRLVAAVKNSDCSFTIISNGSS